MVPTDQPTRVGDDSEDGCAIGLGEGDSPTSEFIPAEIVDEHNVSAIDSLEEPRPPTPRRRLYMMVLADFGLSFTWLCKFAVATPYFQHSLEAGAFLSHLVWIMGPLSGLVVAPVVGVLSDRCTWSLGRRRPFIAGGLLACLAGMNVFANAKALSFGYMPAARWVAFLAFGVLDFSTNAIMFPSRALMGDLLPGNEQHAVQSAAAVVASLAEICAGAYIYSWKDPVTQVSRIFLVASVMLAVTCAVSLCVCREEPLQPGDDSVGGRASAVELTRMDSAACRTEDVELGDSFGSDDIHRVTSEDGEVTTNEAGKGAGDDGKGVDDTGDGHVGAENDDEVESRLSVGLKGSENQVDSARDSRSGLAQEAAANTSLWGDLVATVKSAIVNFPKPLIKVGVVYGLAWFLWFASLPFYSQWLGVDVLDGDPKAPVGSKASLQYERGVSVFSIANVAKALLAMVFSAYYPEVIKWVGAVGERVVFGASFIVFSGVLFASAYTKSVAIAGGVIALGSVPFIVTQTIPIAIVVQRFPDNLASNLGVLNLFCVIPQLIDTLYTGKVAEIAGESAVLRVAACWGFAAGFAAVIFL